MSSPMDVCRICIVRSSMPSFLVSKMFSFASTLARNSFILASVLEACLRSSTVVSGGRWSSAPLPWVLR